MGAISKMLFCIMNKIKLIGSFQFIIDFSDSFIFCITKKALCFASHNLHSSQITHCMPKQKKMMNYIYETLIRKKINVAICQKGRYLKIFYS